MRALVTGISGFVGGHLARHLITEGDVVVGLSASGCWSPELQHLGKNIRIERFNLVEHSEADLGELLRLAQPGIYHLAAQSNPQDSLADPRGTWLLNLGGSLNLLEAIKMSEQKPRVVLISSGICYGNPSPELFRLLKTAHCVRAILMRQAKLLLTSSGSSITWHMGPTL